MVQRWAEQFGTDAIILRPYERDGRTIDIVEDFMSVLGCDATLVLPRRKRGGMRNPSPRRELMELIRAFNQTDTDIDRDKFFFAVMKANPDFARSADLLDYDECRSLLDEFADANRELVETYYHDRGSAPLFPELEYFDMLATVMEAVVQLVSTQTVPANEEGEQKKKKRRKEGGMSADV
jgi:hypothetical protein